MHIPQTGLRRLRSPFSGTGTFTGHGLANWKPSRETRKAEERATAADDRIAPFVQEFGRFSPPALVALDGRPARGAATARRASRQGPLRLFDRALLLIELACALVVFWLVSQYIYTVYIDTTPHRLTPAAGGNTGARSATARPTRTAISTPTRVAEVNSPLVGAPPTSPALAITPTPTSTPTATPTVDPQLLLPVRLRIPVMFLDSPVREVKVNMGVWQVAPMDVGHHIGTANPGEVGNMVLAAHRDINSALFRELDRLQPGDEVFVSNSLREYRYVVTDSFVVNPDQTEVMAPTNDKRVTLITCTPIGLDTQRLIVTAILDDGSDNK